MSELVGHFRRTKSRPPRQPTTFSLASSNKQFLLYDVAVGGRRREDCVLVGCAVSHHDPAINHKVPSRMQMDADMIDTPREAWGYPSGKVLWGGHRL